jgi:hypothetical protein
MAPSTFERTIPEPVWLFVTVWSPRFLEAVQLTMEILRWA